MLFYTDRSFLLTSLWLIPVFYSLGRASSPFSCFCLLPFFLCYSASYFLLWRIRTDSTRHLKKLFLVWLAGWLLQPRRIRKLCVWTLSPKSFSLSQQFCLSSILWIRESFLLFPSQKHSPSANTHTSNGDGPLSTWGLALRNDCSCGDKGNETNAIKAFSKPLVNGFTCHTREQTETVIDPANRPWLFKVQ